MSIERTSKDLTFGVLTVDLQIYYLHSIEFVCMKKINESHEQHFIPGLKLNKLFYSKVVKVLMDKNFPGLKYSAGLVGHGSDVLGVDTPESADHDWGPYLHIFLSTRDFEKYKPQVDRTLRDNLPYTFMGFSTNFTDEQEGYLKHQPIFINKGPVNHMFRFWTPRSFFEHYLAFDPYKKPALRDWLTFPQQALLELTSGELYRDDLNVGKLRRKFAYFPYQVWVYIYFRQWGKIGDIESFMYRTGQVGDELGSNIIATKVVQEMMELTFLQEKRYIPYPKWFGTMFSKLSVSKQLLPLFLRVVHAKRWEEREKYLVKAYGIIARRHNRLKLTSPIKTKIKNFSERPFKLPKGYEVYTKIYEEHIKKRKSTKFVPRLKYHLGAIDQFMDFAQLNRLKYVYRQFRHVIR